jgi:DNA (cytosine-5)-methyltransferase 1
VSPSIDVAKAGGVAVSGTLRGHPRPGSNSLSGTTGVRRLTPRECERLQGFPDDYTLIPYRGRLAADGPRYKALGNSMAVPVMRWIGERIRAVQAAAGRRAARGGDPGAERRVARAEYQLALELGS